jgi:hypothetical protein
MNAYFLSHNGLGDNITMSSAVSFLLQHYDTIYFLCKDKYEENVKLLFQNKKVITVPINSNDEFNDCKKIIDNVDHKDDIFISGFCHTSYLKSRITKKINYKKNKVDGIIHIKNFYNDINLDLSVYYNYFNIESTEISKSLLDRLINYKIIFLHTEGSNRSIDITDIVNTYKNNKEYILICANKNVYDDNTHIANEYVNLKVVYYIDIIKNANIIHIIDSCFSCIVHPLSVTNKLKASKINIISF